MITSSMITSGSSVSGPGPSSQFPNCMHGGSGGGGQGCPGGHGLITIGSQFGLVGSGHSGGSQSGTMLPFSSSHSSAVSSTSPQSSVGSQHSYSQRDCMHGFASGSKLHAVGSQHPSSVPKNSSQILSPPLSPVVRFSHSSHSKLSGVLLQSSEVTPP